MDVASDQVIYAKRGGLFKERRTDLAFRPDPRDDDDAADEAECARVEELRERVRGSSSRRRSSNKSRKGKRHGSQSTSNMSDKQINQRRPEQESDASTTEEVTPLRKILQREASFAEMEGGSDLAQQQQQQRDDGEGGRLHRVNSCVSMASSIASSASSAQRQAMNKRVSSSSRSRGSSALGHNSASSSSPSKPSMDSDVWSDSGSSVSVSQSLREKRQSVLRRIAEAKVMAMENRAAPLRTHGTRGVTTTTTTTPVVASAPPARRERIGGKDKDKSTTSGDSEGQGDDSLVRYLERAVRSVGEQFQFGSMKVLPTDRRDEVGIAIAESGIGAQEPLTVSDLFEMAVGSCGAHKAFKSRLSAAAGGGWVEWTWQEYYFDVVKTAKALISLGVQRHDSVLLAGSSSPQQAIAHFGAIFAGALPTSLFPTDDAEVYVDIAVRTGAVMVLVEDAEAMDKFIAQDTLDQLSKVEAFVMWGTSPELTPNSVSEFDIPVYHWDEFLALGADVPNADLELRLDAQRHGHACAIAVTPGARGFSSPKLVLLTHDNLTWSAFSFTKGAVENLKWGDARGGERTVSLLPLASTATLVLDLYVPLTLAGVFERSQVVHFAAADVAAGGNSAVVDCLRAVRPTALFASPHIYDGLNDVLLHGSTRGMAAAATSTADHKSIPDNHSISSSRSAQSERSLITRSASMLTGFRKAPVSRRSSTSSLSSSSSSSSQSLGGRLASRFSSMRFSTSSSGSKSEIPTLSRRHSGMSQHQHGAANNVIGGGSSKKRIGGAVLQGLADVLVFKSHKERLGLDQCKLLLSFGGTLPGNVLNAFASHNMHIAEAYGMAESSGLVSLSWPTASCAGAVGSLVDSVELQCINSRSGKRLRPGVEGELVLRGRCVAMGYLDDQCRSDTTISVDGFLRTGDVGSVAQAGHGQGYLFLLGRVANRIVLSDNPNRYIFPEPIERVLMSKLPMVQHAVVIGNHHKHLTLLLTLAQTGVLGNDNEDSNDDDDKTTSTTSSRGGGASLIPKCSSGRLSTSSSQRSLQRQNAKREQNINAHASTLPRQAHHQLNSQHHHHPQFKQTERELNAILAPRARVDGATTLGQAKLSPAYMGRIHAAVEWYNDSELCTSDSDKIRGFTILDDVFDAQGDRPELCATMMVNRPLVQEKHRNAIKRMYLPGFSSLKQSSYFGLHQATMAGKFDVASGKFTTKPCNNKKGGAAAHQTSGVKYAVETETHTDLTGIHTEEVYKTKRGISKFVSTSEPLEVD